VRKISSIKSVMGLLSPMLRGLLRIQIVLLYVMKYIQKKKKDFSV